MSVHVYADLQQGTEEWFAARRGIVTASTVGRLVTSKSPDATTIACPACEVEAGPCLSLSRKTPTELKAVHSPRLEAASDLPPVLQVADNDESRNLTLLLVAERVAGWTDPTFMSADMWRGVEHEPIARDIYSGHYQQAVECGFMRRDEDGWTLGYSPDGLVADDGLVEIKAPRAKAHLNTILADSVPPYYMPQLQAGLLVSSREWIDFVSYTGGLPLFVKRVYPDPAWFDAITAACIQFEESVTAMRAEYEARIVGMPTTERVQFEMVI